jgi:mitofilin
MDQGSLELSMRYMTLLEGASRVVADNWIKEVQMMLEMQQSIQAMMFYTTAKSLAFLEINDSKVKH